MCHERLDLGPADFAGIKNMYCAVTANENCTKPQTWTQAYFGHALGTCTPVEYEVSDVMFQLVYDRNRALNNEVPYSGSLFDSKINDGSEVRVVGVSELEQSSDVFSTMELAGNEGSRFIWDIKASKLSGASVNCMFSPWLKKQI